MMIEASRVTVLRRVTGLRHLPQHTLDGLASQAISVSVAACEPVRSDGHVIVIVDGCADVYREGRQIGEVGPGELVTGAPLDVVTRDADVVARTPMRLLLLPRDVVDATLGDMEVTAAFLHSALARLRQS